jgi:transcriptional regulator with XRE-family HTH domain
MNTAAKIDETYMREVFAWNLRKRLHDLGLTQQRFAAELGCSTKVVGDWTNARNSPKWESIAKICNALQCTPDYLMRDRYVS